MGRVNLTGLEGLLVVCLVAAVAPLVARLLPGPQIAQVVLLIIGGVLVGPEVLGVDPGLAEVGLIADVGVGFLFLLAGYEFDPSLFRRREGRLGALAWLASVVVSVVLVVALDMAGLVNDYLAVAIALTTTALGTLLPILHDNHMLSGAFGRYAMAGGAAGELFPILAIALLLSTRSEYVAVVSLLTVGGMALGLMLLSRTVHGRALERLVLEGADTTAQTTLRWTIVLLLALLVATGEFGIDSVLGAFLAGAVLRRWVVEGEEALGRKLEAIGHGFFIPVFFVYSGMTLDIVSVAETPWLMVGVLVLLVLSRALPVYLLHRRVLPHIQRVQLALCSATTLPLLVALAEIGRRNGSMSSEGAAALVGAGVLSVLLFPVAAVWLEDRRRRTAESPEVV